MALTTQPHLVLRFRKRRAITLLPSCVFMAGYEVNFTFMFTVFPNEGKGGGYASFVSRVHLIEHIGPDLYKHFLCPGTAKTVL